MKDGGMKLYEQLAAEISRQIHAGVLRAGERIPSVRQASRSRRVSTGTVLQAYALLENRGEITARPRSGYYVSARRKAWSPEPEISRPRAASISVNVSDLVFEILQTVKSPDIVPLGSAFPSPSLFPLPRLARALAVSARRLDPHSMVADLPLGNPELRRWIARRYLESGSNVPMDEIVITTGALEGLNLCLQAVARPGDLIAIESPAFYAALEAIERLGLKALELPTSPRDGVDLAALDAALKRHPVKACWFMTSFQNPLGSLMPEGKKRELVALLAKRDIPLIEDDVYNELYFGAEKPKPAKAFDRKGLVLHCSSFSKCLAPGYRVGWALAGRYAQQVERAKLMTTIATSIPPQAAITEYLKYGGYNRHLRGLRHALAAQQNRMLQAAIRHFPAGTRMTRPQGGYFVWIEMPESVNALELHRLAMANNISIAPGPIFSPQRKYTHCIRLNYGIPWSSRVDAAMATLGNLAASLR